MDLWIVVLVKNGVAQTAELCTSQEQASDCATSYREACDFEPDVDDVGVLEASLGLPIPEAP